MRRRHRVPPATLPGLEPLSPGHHGRFFLLLGAMLLVIGLIDYRTGPLVYLTDLYMVPILLTSWVYGLRPAVMLAALVMAYRLGLYSLVWRNTGLSLGTALYNLASEGGFVLVILVLLARLQRSLATARRLALRDDLTGAANRRAFYERAAAALARCGRDGQPISLAYLDVDDFKGINDRHGHHHGDLLLAEFAAILRRHAHPDDLVARLGGDEFAVLMPTAAAAQAQHFGQQLQATLAAAARNRQPPLRASIGIVTFIRPPASVDELVARADALMYTAKQHGKDNLVVATAA